MLCRYHKCVKGKLSHLCFLLQMLGCVISRRETHLSFPSEINTSELYSLQKLTRLLHETIDEGLVDSEVATKVLGVMSTSNL